MNWIVEVPDVDSPYQDTDDGDDLNNTKQPDVNADEARINTRAAAGCDPYY